MRRRPAVPPEAAEADSGQEGRSLVELSHHGLEALELLERGWPGSLTPQMQSAFSKLRGALAGLPRVEGSTPSRGGAVWSSSEEAGPRHFDILDLIRHVFKAHDLLFLSRQVTYHIATSADLPMAWADAGQVGLVVSQVVEHLVRRAARASRVAIELARFALRSGPGLEVRFSSVDRHFSDVDRNAFVTELFQERIDPVSGVSLSDCRQAVVRQRGQLWVDFPKPNQPVYHVVLPVSQESAAHSPSAQQTFKYDISIANYADVRKRFGIRKSQSLVAQIEHYIRALVRYPIDVVLALSDKGVITTIYETQRGAAQSVASRISQRLGSETFRIGKRPVELAFSYHLSPLSPQPAPLEGQAKSPGHY